MSQFPFQLDSDVDLPRVDNNITEIGGEAINALRSAMMAVEANIGIGAGGAGSIAQRLNTSLDEYGNILPSALVNLLTIVQITNAQVAPGAAIQESKLALSYSTASLYNLYVTLKTSVDILNGFLTLTGVKLEPHIDGIDYNHLLSAILVDPSTSFVKTSPGALPGVGTNVVNRNTTNADTLISDISNDLVVHEKSDSSAGVTPTSGGTVPPLNYAHMAAGIFVDTASFTTIPQSDDDVQSVVEYIDSSSLLLLGSRVQNFYANGVSRTSRSSNLLADGYGAPIVPPTPVIAYFLGVPPGPASSSPVDNFNDGDDVILFTPTPAQLSTFNFDAQFAQVSPGDLLTIDYGTGIYYQFAVDSVKSIVNSAVNPPVRQYAVRINGKNPVSDGYAYAQIDNATFNRNKYAVVATTRAPNSISAYESLIVINPRSALALGNGFNPSQFDASHYNLYLTLLPNGNLTNIFALPPIDVTGNQGATPGAYTLDSIVNTINTAFRAPGYNYRFNAFEYNGQIGIALDPYNNASFSIVSGVPDGYGVYTGSSNALYPNNVVDGYNLIDPLGFGLTGANIASPPPATSYQSVLAAEFAPTLLFYPLKRNYFYANGSELEMLKSDPLVLNDIEDSFGDGYWPAVISNVNTTASTVSVTYTVNYDIAQSGLAIGKTIVVQPVTPITGTAGDTNYGRFIVSNIVFNPCENSYTTITVYDAVHGTGVSPYAVLPVGTAVNVYFSDDSVSFDAENVFDGEVSGPFKRFFEVYVDSQGHTFTHERARFLLSGNDPRLNGNLVPTDIALINMYGVSPKLRGYLSPYINGNVIYLSVSSYNTVTGQYTAQLCSSTFTNFGPLTTGKVGEIVRFYDFTNVDYIDFIFTLTTPPPAIVAFTSSSISTNKNIAIQLFDSLELDQTFMLLATCQVNDNSKSVSYLTDQRQFGNVSEEQFTDSALDFITSNPRHTMQNGVVRGFDLFSSNVLTSTTTIYFDGGIALTNGNLIAINAFDVNMPLLRDNGGGTGGILWAICVNEENEVQLIPLTDYNPAVNTINSPGRLLQVINVLNSQIYYVDSTTFSTLLNTRKDLTVLWLVNAQVTNATTYSFTISDARKYVVDANANAPIVLTNASSQGNFNSFASLNTWITYNSAFQNNVVVRGDYTFSSDPGFAGDASYQGDGCTFTINTPITLPNNCSFSNCNIIVNSNTGFIIPGDASDIAFSNCTFTYSPSSGYAVGNIINAGNAAIYSLVSSLANVSITNCTFTTSNTNRPSFIAFEYNSSSVIAQTIRITNNKFYNTSSSDDINAVIAFTCTSTSNQPTEGLKLVDCLIQNNICDKDQLISITGTPNSNPTMLCSIVLIATKIVDNTCGTISVVGAADNDRNYETITTGFAYDKGYGVIIQNNTCRYIGMLNSTGASLFYNAYYGGSVTQEFNTCTMLINNNACSWIQLVPNALSTSAYEQNAYLLITDNMLRAYSTAYLFLFSSAIINAGIALANGGNTGSPVLTTCTIKGNTITQGSALNSTPSVVTYDYQQSMNIGISAIIDGNVCNNIQSVPGGNTSADMIQLYSTPLGFLNVSITNNQFYRNSNTIRSYINTLTTTVNGVITNNFFDQSTVDGTSYTLVANASYFNGPIVQNKNQVGFSSLDMNQLNWYPAWSYTAELGFALANGTFSYLDTVGVSNTGWALLIDATVGGAGPLLNINGSLDSVIPQGAKLLYVMFGAELIAGSGSNTIGFKILPGKTNSFSISSPPTSFAGSMADFNGTGQWSSAQISGTSASLSTVDVTEFAYLNTSSYNLISGNGYTIQFQLNVSCSDTAKILLSPIMLKYQW